MEKKEVVPKSPGTVSSRWLAAAVMGTWWGAFEIIVGSFLHNLRVPMSGTVLSFFSVVLLVAFHQLWQERGIILRAGLVAAFMKSLSPSAVILGPMTGILMEALFLEFFILIAGRNLAGYLLGGAFAVLSALLHKIFSLLILYGFDFVTLLEKLYEYAVVKLNIHERFSSPWYALLLLTAIYVLTGMAAAILGWFTGRKAGNERPEEEKQTFIEPDNMFRDQGTRHFTVLLLFVHLFMLVFLLWAIGHFAFLTSAALTLGYLTGVLIRYRRPVRYLKKPFFWIQLFILTLLAAMFWNGLQTGDFFNREGLLVGLRMNLRAVLVMVSFSAISVELRNPLVRALLFKRGFSNLYLSLGLAFAALPVIAESFAKPREAFRNPYGVVLGILRQADRMREAFKKSLEQRPILFIVSGEINSGKTSFLTFLVSWLQKRAWTVGGFLAPGEMEQGEKMAYRLRVLPEGEERELCRVQEKKKLISTGRYTFNPETIRWGEKMIHPSRCATFDVIVVDEVGPLELKGEGWAGVLGKLILLKDSIQIWSVRSSVLERVQAVWTISPEDIFVPGKDDPKQAARKIEEVLIKIKDPGKQKA